MTCQECGERAATVTVNTVINGVKSTKHICENCAGKMGIAFPSMNALLSNFFAPASLFEAQEQTEEACPDCGYRFSQFQKTGFLGCDRCYDHFRDALKPFVKRIQGGVVHKDENEQAPARKSCDRLAELKKQLSDAVEAEKYEKAAQLRDMIRELEGGAKA